MGDFLEQHIWAGYDVNQHGMDAPGSWGVKYILNLGWEFRPGAHVESIQSRLGSGILIQLNVEYTKGCTPFFLLKVGTQKINGSKRQHWCTFYMVF